MADPMGLDVHGIQVQQRPSVNPATMKVQTVHAVKYHVGTHGPFEDEYPPGTYTPEQVQSNIAKQVQNLRVIVGAHAPAPNTPK